MCRVFHEKQEDLQNLAFMTLRPTGKISIDALYMYMETQNKTHHNLRRLMIKGINSILQQVMMKDLYQDSHSLRQFFLNARDEKQEPILLGLELASYGNTFATYTVTKEPQERTLSTIFQ